MPSGEDATPSKLGRYELITRIGQGGMADVQLALQRGPAGFEKLVVVKLVHERLASEKAFVDMLLDEARVAALLKHPNVVDIYDLGEVGGRYFIAMEYLDGEPLLSVLRAGKDGKRLDVDSMARLIADTADGLEAAHELRSMAGKPLSLVHHDVSLGNIVVLYNGQAKLVDFGVAKATQSSAATKTTIQGKFSYMAPEKLRGEPGDRRSDIFSLGVVLWEALTLRRLFKGQTEAETMEQVLTTDIPLPSVANPDVPTHYDAVVMKAIDRDPTTRYQTAKALADDLEAVLHKQNYPRKNDAIARYMQETFKAHIDARQKLLQEVSQKGTASEDVLQAAFIQPPIIAASPGKDRNDFSLRFSRLALPLEPPAEVPAGTPSDPQPVLVRTSPRPTRPRPAPRNEPEVDDHELIEISTPVPLQDDLEIGEQDEQDEAGAYEDPEAAARKRKRLLLASAIGGGVVIVALLAIVLARGGGGDDKPPVAKSVVVADAAVAIVPPPIDAPEPDAAVAVIVEPPDAAPSRPLPPHPTTTTARPPPPPPTGGSGSAAAPQTAEALQRLALQAYIKGDNKTALDDLRKAQHVNPNYAPTWRVLGLVYERIGEIAQARIAFVRYLQLAPNAPDAASTRAKLEHLGR